MIDFITIKYYMGEKEFMNQIILSYLKDNRILLMEIKRILMQELIKISKEVKYLNIIHLKILMINLNHNPCKSFMIEI